MAFPFFALLEVITRKAESFKFWGFFSPKNCTSPAEPHNSGVPSPGQHIQLQCLPTLSRSSLPSLWVPEPACIISANVFFYTGEKIKPLFALPRQLELPPPYLGSATASSARLLSQPNTVEAEENSAFPDLLLLPSCRAGSTLSTTSVW